MSKNANNEYKRTSEELINAQQKLIQAQRHQLATQQELIDRLRQMVFWLSAGPVPAPNEFN